MKKDIFELYTWVYRGKQRRAIILVLDKPKTPTKIKEETKIKVTNVSDVLRAMEKKGLVKCLNPKDKLGRFYDLTKVGKEVVIQFK